MDPLMPDFTLKKWNEIVDQYRRKYARLTAWQELNIRQVELDKGFLYGPTGRIYTIPMEPHKKHPGVMVYSETCIKNYPVQGTATGDVVPLAMNMIQDRMWAEPRKYMSTNWMGQVHDSVIFDTIQQEVKQTAYMCISQFELLPQRLEDIWGVKVNIPLTGEATWGPSYADQLHSVKHEGGQWIMK